MASLSRYRLRIGETIVGYLRQEGSRNYYSTDGLWWNGIPLPYELADRFSGIRDKNNRMLYEKDVVSVPFPDEPVQTAIMLIQFDEGRCMFIEIEGNRHLDATGMERIPGLALLGFAFGE